MEIYAKYGYITIKQLLMCIGTLFVLGSCKTPSHDLLKIQEICCKFALPIGMDPFYSIEPGDWLALIKQGNNKYGFRQTKVSLGSIIELPPGDREKVVLLLPDSGCYKAKQTIKSWSYSEGDQSATMGQAEIHMTDKEIRYDPGNGTVIYFRRDTEHRLWDSENIEEGFKWVGDLNQDGVPDLVIFGNADENGFVLKYWGEFYISNGDGLTWSSTSFGFETD